MKIKKVLIKKQKYKSGFTIIEIMLSVAILTILFGLSAAFYQSFQVSNDLDIAVNVTSQSLRRAQILSQSVEGDSTWGVHIESGNIVLFKGVDYVSRDTDYDEAFDVPTSIIPSGISDVVFSKMTGYSQNTGTITFTTTNNEISNIIINAKGLVQY